MVQASVEGTVIVAVMISRAMPQKIRLLRRAFSMVSVQLVIVQRTPARFVPLLVVNEQNGSEGLDDASQTEG